MALTLLTEADFRKQIKTAPAAAYLLFGEEDYLKTFALDQAREALCPDETLRCFNELTIDALDYTPDRLRSALMALPMMAEKKLVVLRGLNLSGMKAGELDALCEVLGELEEYSYNTLLIPVAAGLVDEARNPKELSPMLKRLGALLTLVRFDRCTPQKLVGWCARHVEHHGVRVSPAVCGTLIEYCGRNMFTLAAEIDKLCYYVLSKGRDELTAEDVRTVGCHCPEFDSFALTNAILDRNGARALDVLADLRFRRVEPIFVLGEISSMLQRMQLILLLMREGHTPDEIAAAHRWSPFQTAKYARGATAIGQERLRRMILLCTEADVALKSQPKSYLPLETFICSM